MFKLTILYAFFFVIISMPVIVGCNNGDAPTKKSGPIKRDTTGSLFLVRPPGMGKSQATYGKMVIVSDTFSVKSVGVGKWEERWGPDTSYLAIFPWPKLDSLNIPIKDSAGREILIPTEFPIEKKFVRNGHTHVEELLKELDNLK